MPASSEIKILLVLVLFIGITLYNIAFENLNSVLVTITTEGEFVPTITSTLNLSLFNSSTLQPTSNPTSPPSPSPSPPTIPK
mmetsp:Transcript_22533/g.46805  ORF Transcript_22533/g.46805 Transcript_22533/m.46805 type:complete len:82 (-) Transcript_22533:123-368(-)